MRVREFLESMEKEIEPTSRDQDRAYMAIASSPRLSAIAITDSMAEALSKGHHV